MGSSAPKKGNLGLKMPMLGQKVGTKIVKTRQIYNRVKTIKVFLFNPNQYGGGGVNLPPRLPRLIAATGGHGLTPNFFLNSS